MHLLVDDVGRIAPIQEAIDRHDVRMQTVEYVPLGPDHVALHMTVRGRGEHVREAIEGLRSVDSVMGITALVHGAAVRD
ncbi:hypothetical protein BH23ACT9_BH23ACT9_05130 [soil metagenome]